jgi:hypothetical protein
MTTGARGPGGFGGRSHTPDLTGYGRDSIGPNGPRYTQGHTAGAGGRHNIGSMLRNTGNLLSSAGDLLSTVGGLFGQQKPCVPSTQDAGNTPSGVYGGAGCCGHSGSRGLMQLLAPLMDLLQAIMKMMAPKPQTPLLPQQPPSEVGPMNSIAAGVLKSLQGLLGGVSHTLGQAGHSLMPHQHLGRAAFGMAEGATQVASAVAGLASLALGGGRTATVA